MTYPYLCLNGKTQTIKDIIENKNDISKNILESKKPMIIFGESFSNTKSANYLFHSFKNFLSINDKFSAEWNPLNILSIDAATVGNFDLDILNDKENLIKDLNENKFELIYLLGQDNLIFNKKNEFVVY